MTSNTTMRMSSMTTSTMMMMMPATTTPPLRLGTLGRFLAHQVGSRGELSETEASFSP